MCSTKIRNIPKLKSHNSHIYFKYEAQNDSGQSKIQFCAWVCRWKFLSCGQPGWDDAVSCQEGSRGTHYLHQPYLFLLLSLQLSELSTYFYKHKQTQTYRLYSSGYFLSPSRPLAMQFFCVFCLFCFSLLEGLCYLFFSPFWWPGKLLSTLWFAC